MAVPGEGLPERLGPYRIRDRLGEGGMGVVYLATDPSLRLVAVKALRHGLTSEISRQRLTREFEMMRRVQDPHVAEVIDASIQHDPPYIVTRYVPGRTVEDVVAQGGPLTGRALQRLAWGLASALTAVHAAGIVHRDLKPANVMLVSGEPVVIDFGIAQALDSTRLTASGMLMGTPGYLAPEVIEGSPSGPAADVHSWAATLAYAATGRPPFGSGSYEAIFYRIVNGQPDLATTPAPLLPLVLQALARDPARRPSAAELAGRVAALDPASLVPDLAPTLAPGLPGVTHVSPVPGAAMAGPAIAAPGLAAAPDSYSDLLPPVHYQPPAQAPPLASPLSGMAPPGMAQPWPGPVGPPGLPPPGAAGMTGAAGPATRSRSPRTPLVLAAMATIIGASILLPLAGTAAALAVLVALRAADVTSTWLTGRRSRAGRAASAAAAVAYAPVALLRSLLHLIAVLPLALLVAACAAAVTLLATPDASRAAGYASGALVACYGLGPGSARCRRPLSRFFGAVTGSTPTAVVAFIGMSALAIGTVAAAVTLPPSIWPVIHLSQWAEHLPAVRFFRGLPADFRHWRGMLNPFTRWLG